MSDPGPIVGVANLDYEAAGQQRYETVQRMTEGVPAFDVDWHELPAEERDKWIAEVKPYVDAALGLTDTDPV